MVVKKYKILTVLYTLTAVSPSPPFRENANRGQIGSLTSHTDRTRKHFVIACVRLLLLRKRGFISHVVVAAALAAAALAALSAVDIEIFRPPRLWSLW